jgi:hypothetical protein
LKDKVTKGKEFGREALDIKRHDGKVRVVFNLSNQ